MRWSDIERIRDKVMHLIYFLKIWNYSKDNARMYIFLKCYKDKIMTISACCNTALMHFTMHDKMLRCLQSVKNNDNVY